MKRGRLDQHFRRNLQADASSDSVAGLNWPSFRLDDAEMKISSTTRVFHIDTNLGTATHLLNNQGACGCFEGQWWYINNVRIHGRGDSTQVQVSIVPHGDGPNGCRQTDIDALLISAEEKPSAKQLVPVG